jgi:hypothetical protein
LKRLSRAFRSKRADDRRHRAPLSESPLGSLLREFRRRDIFGQPSVPPARLPRNLLLVAPRTRLPFLPQSIIRNARIERRKRAALLDLTGIPTQQRAECADERPIPGGRIRPARATFPFATQRGPTASPQWRCYRPAGCRFPCRPHCCAGMRLNPMGLLT